MYRLVYVSKAAAELTDDHIGSILDSSQSNNYERFLTGFLLHNGNGFMQALEGDETEVREVFNRICEDDRHDGVVQIIGENIRERAFPDWAMNYYRVDSQDSQTAMLARRDDPVDSLLPENMPRNLLYLFSQFMKVRRQPLVSS